VVRNTSARPVPMPTCGAVIQPIAVMVVSTARPLAAAAQAMPPVATSGRAGLAHARHLSRSPTRHAAARPGTAGHRARGRSGASAETLTNPILATIRAAPSRRAALTGKTPVTARPAGPGRDRRDAVATGTAASALAPPHDVAHQGGGPVGVLPVDRKPSPALPSWPGRCRTSRR
jgi:hypothetical protein